MSRTRKHFTDEFKCEAVRLCNERGAVISEIARDLGIGENLLRRWVRLARDGALEMDTSKPLRAEALSEVQRLQRELRRVTMARDILKKRSASSRTTKSEVCLHSTATRSLADRCHVPVCASISSSSPAC
jgi:transposase